MSRSPHQLPTSSDRATVRVVNAVEGVVYHLVFDGNIRRVSGRQLRRHIQRVSHIPAEAQVLLVGDAVLPNDSTTCGKMGLDPQNAVVELRYSTDAIREHSGIVASPSSSSRPSTAAGTLPLPQQNVTGPSVWSSGPPPPLPATPTGVAITGDVEHRRSTLRGQQGTTSAPVSSSYSTYAARRVVAPDQLAEEGLPHRSSGSPGAAPSNANGRQARSHPEVSEMLSTTILNPPTTLDSFLTGDAAIGSDSPHPRYGRDTTASSAAAAINQSLDPGRGRPLAGAAPLPNQRRSISYEVPTPPRLMEQREPYYPHGESDWPAIPHRRVSPGRKSSPLLYPSDASYHCGYHHYHQPQHRHSDHLLDGPAPTSVGLNYSTVDPMVSPSYEESSPLVGDREMRRAASAALQRPPHPSLQRSGGGGGLAVPYAAPDLWQGNMDDRHHFHDSRYDISSAQLSADNLTAFYDDQNHIWEAEAQRFGNERATRLTALENQRRVLVSEAARYDAEVAMLNDRITREWQKLDELQQVLVASTSAYAAGRSAVPMEVEECEDIIVEGLL